MAEDEQEQSHQLNELQLVVYRILETYDAICREYDLRYFLTEGTLLGAIRHQGFIPWDDDIDIMMPREDYEKFLKIAPQNLDTDLYQIQHSSTVENYWSPFIKLRLLKHDGSYVQARIAHLTDANGPLIDIFPLDSVPRAKSFAQSLNGFYVKFLRRALAVKLNAHRIKSYKQRIIKWASYFFSVRGLHKRLDRSFQRFNKSTNEYVVNWGSYYPAWKETFPKSDVLSEVPRLAPFEEGSFPVPVQAERVLTSIYGDYMVIPKEPGKGHFAPARKNDLL